MLKCCEYEAVIRKAEDMDGPVCYIIGIQKRHLSENRQVGGGRGACGCAGKDGLNLALTGRNAGTGPFHIVLVEPEIPPNTGNIARTCAATGTRLHLVGPLGFEVSDRTVRRAGLDYWPFVDLTVHESLEAFLEAYADAPLWLVSTRGERSYAEAVYEEGAMLLFGKETKGLPRALIEERKDRTIRIPMLPDERLRSLNLANSAALVLYEALRQRGFEGLV